MNNLTPAQEAKIPEYVDKWLNVPLLPTDFVGVEKYVTLMYQRLNEKKPKILFAKSPGAAVELAKVETKLTETEIKNEIYFTLWWLDWAGWYDFSQKELGKTYQKDDLDLFMGFVSKVHAIIPLPGLAIVSENPTNFHWNAEKQLHNKNGRAIEYQDDWGFYIYKGSIMKKKYILDPYGLTRKEFIEEQNVETRKYLVELLGADKIMQILDVQLIDRDKVACEEAELFKTKEKDPITRDYIWFVKVKCPSTGTYHTHCVRPNQPSVWDAVASMWGLKAEEYYPEREA